MNFFVCRNVFYNKFFLCNIIVLKNFLLLYLEYNTMGLLGKGKVGLISDDWRHDIDTWIASLLKYFTLRRISSDRFWFNQKNGYDLQVVCLRLKYKHTKKYVNHDCSQYCFIFCYIYSKKLFLLFFFCIISLFIKK